jgi:transcriptional regulator with XRE-family HTH domain
MSRAQSSDIDRFVAHRMKELRLCAGITQRQVAKQLGLSDQQMHKFENAKLRVSASQLLAGAVVFDVPVTALFNGCDGGAWLDPLRDFETSRMLLNVTRSFLELEPKHRGRRSFLTARRVGSWCWSWRHSQAPHLAWALSWGSPLGHPRSPVPVLVERLIAPGWRRGLQDPGRRRRKNSQGGPAGRRSEGGGGSRTLRAEPGDED